MSNGEASADQLELPDEWRRLERAARRLLEANAQLRSRADAAELRLRELEAAVGRLRSGPVDPLALSTRVAHLEAENRSLQERLGQARERVRSILGRLEFLEAGH